MMEYEIFKGVVGEKFKEFLPEKYQDAQVEIRPVDKVNRTLDGLSIRVNEPGMNISPTIYVNHMYEDYVTTENLNATLERAAEGFIKAMEQKESINVSELTNAECAKDKIVFQLINTEQNKEMLANMPHREFKDLSVIYRMVVKIDGEGIASTPVHNGLADTLGFTEEQLFKLAAENTKRLLPPVVKSMNDVMREIFMKDGMPPEIADMMLGEMPPEQQMYVISNNKGINGAVSMLYEDGLHDLAEKLGSDLYIMPSSIHEVIAVSTDMGNPNELAAMVAEINMDQVALDERLSNQVYHYDKDLRKVTLATDTPNKRLDGIVAEAPIIDKDTFYKTRERMEHIKKKHLEVSKPKADVPKKPDNILVYKTKCACCGGSVLIGRHHTYSDKFYYKCKNRRKLARLCDNKYSYDYSEVMDSVFSVIRQHMSLCVEKTKFVQKMNSRKENVLQYDIYTKQIAKLQNDVRRITANKSGLYEDYREQLITAEELCQYQKEYECRVNEIEAQITELLHRRSLYEKEFHIDEGWEETVNKYMTKRKLTKELVDAFVSEIVFNDGNIEVKLLYDDFLKELLEVAEEREVSSNG